jgi:ferritin-like metal-binding protein YciE
LFLALAGTFLGKPRSIQEATALQLRQWRQLPQTQSTAADRRKFRGLDMAKSPEKTSQDMALNDLFEHALKDMYYAEKKIQKALPKMIKAAESPDLKKGLEGHLTETGEQIEMLEKVFEIIGKKPKAERCDAIEGILEEGDGLLEDFGKTNAVDAAIIFSCQAVEHYEITRYGSMHAFAKVLGMNDAAKLIATILKQEKAADEKLSGLAETRINYAAAA